MPKAIILFMANRRSDNRDLSMSSEARFGNGTRFPSHRRVPKRAESGSDEPTSMKQSKGMMSFLTSNPFARSWAAKEGQHKGMRIGKRTRKPDEQDCQIQSNNNTIKKDQSNLDSSSRPKPRIPGLRKAQERLSKLKIWQRKTTTNVVAYSSQSELSTPLASEDELSNPRTKEKEQVSKNGCSIQRIQLQQSSRDFPSLSSKSGSVPQPSVNHTGLPFRKFLSRSMGNFQANVTQDSDRIIRTVSSEDTGTNSFQTARMEEEDVDEEEVIFSFDQVPPKQDPRPISTTQPEPSNSARGVGMGSFSQIDTDSTLCIQPSLVETSFSLAEGDTDISASAWKQPRPKKRKKKKKPRHGDDAKLIGMIICFDPTAALLDMGKEPQRIGKTLLKKLQKVDGYSGYLLGERSDEESSDISPLNNDVLGFHLDCFEKPSKQEELNTEKDDDGALEEEEIEFVFGGAATIAEPAGADSFENSGPKCGDDEIEIAFYERKVEKESRSSSSSSAIDMGLACPWSSSSDDGHALPVEWMLPSEKNPQISNKMLLKTHRDAMRNEPPEYEWFHPDHLDVPNRKLHSPVALFGRAALEMAKEEVVTPSTVAETNISFGSHSSPDLFDEFRSDLVSEGSPPSEAVQSLLDFCQSSSGTSGRGTFSRSSSMSSLPVEPDEGLQKRDVSEMIKVISRGIDF